MNQAASRKAISGQGELLPTRQRTDASERQNNHCRHTRRIFAGRVIRLVFAGFLLVLVFPLSRTSAAEPRGIWWWTSASHPWGVDQVLGDNNKETQALQFLKAWKFGRVYCSFSTQASANPAVIQAWNTKLHAAGIASQFLLSENTWIFPQNRSNLLTVHVQPKLIDFNAAATNAAQRYDPLHLDIEPHGLPQWGTNTPAGRKDYLLLLRDTFQAVRTYLDQHGASDIPVYADLPVRPNPQANFFLPLNSHTCGTCVVSFHGHRSVAVGEVRSIPQFFFILLASSVATSGCIG